MEINLLLSHVSAFKILQAMKSAYMSNLYEGLREASAHASSDLDSGPCVVMICAVVPEESYATVP